jgi:hypothetical protein
MCLAVQNLLKDIHLPPVMFLLGTRLHDVPLWLDVQVMVRPSYVLGGRAMEIVYSDKDLQRYINTAVEVCSNCCYIVQCHQALRHQQSVAACPLLQQQMPQPIQI